MTSKHAPLRYLWEGDGFKPIPRHAKLCDQQFVIGVHYLLELVHERSAASHNHEFAFIATGWDNLPEQYQHEPWAQSPEHLRKHALIMKGFCNTETFTCSSNAEALRWAPRLRSDDEYAVITVKGPLVYRYRAMSQSKKAMGAKEFQRSKQAIMDYIDNLLSVPKGATQREGTTK